jgi:hypothetical protein
MLIKTIKPDSYLENFSNLCKQKFGENLIGLGIYGSYAWGYFDKEKSDYDVFLVFNHEIKDESEIPKGKLERITIQYFSTPKQLFELVREGHWSLYITLLESAKMIYHTSEYETFIGELRKIDFVENLKNTKRLGWKAGFDREVIEKEEGYSGAKYAFPALRSRLQLLTYVKYRKPIWDLNEVIKLNKDFLSLNEQEYIIQLEKSVRERKNVFPDREMAIKTLEKINGEILNLLS